MQRDHDQFTKVINSLSEIGVKITKTKSRLEILKVLEDVESARNFSGLHS